MKKLILFLSLTAFVGLSAFDVPKDVEKVKTEVSKAVKTPLQLSGIESTSYLILPSGAWITIGFNDAKRGTNLMGVCGQDSNGEYYCCQGQPPFLGYCWSCGFQNTTCEK